MLHLLQLKIDKGRIICHVFHLSLPEHFLVSQEVQFPSLLFDDRKVGGEIIILQLFVQFIFVAFDHFFLRQF